VLVNLAKDPISSNFSGNECMFYRKELFHRCHYHSVTSSWPYSSQTDSM